MANIYDVIYYANPWDITKTSPHRWDEQHPKSFVSNFWGAVQVGVVGMKENK